jgi:hypothetical protein
MGSGAFIPIKDCIIYSIQIRNFYRKKFMNQEKGLELNQLLKQSDLELIIFFSTDLVSRCIL